VAAIQVVGVILAAALLVIPAAIGYQVSSNWRGILAVAVASGWIAVSGGLALSYYGDLAAGGTIVLLLAGLFFAALVVAPLVRTRR